MGSEAIIERADVRSCPYHYQNLKPTQVQHAFNGRLQRFRNLAEVGGHRWTLR